MATKNIKQKLNKKYNQATHNKTNYQIAGEYCKHTNFGIVLILAISMLVESR